MKLWFKKVNSDWFCHDYLDVQNGGGNAPSPQTYVLLKDMVSYSNGRRVGSLRFLTQCLSQDSAERALYAQPQVMWWPMPCAVCSIPPVLIHSCLYTHIVIFSSWRRMWMIPSQRPVFLRSTSSSTLTKMPRLRERCGCSQGSILHLWASIWRIFIHLSFSWNRD